MHQLTTKTSQDTSRTLTKHETCMFLTPRESTLGIRTIVQLIEACPSGRARFSRACLHCPTETGRISIPVEYLTPANGSLPIPSFSNGVTASIVCYGFRRSLVVENQCSLDI